MTRQRKVLVLNETAPKRVLHHVTLNLSAVETRYDTYLGEQYFVVPMVMLVEGVHVGSQGPVLYEDADMAKTAPAWNKKPIVVYHPEINGSGVSACDPEILDNCEIGLIFNSQQGADKKLHAEAWLKEERVKKVDNRIWEALEKKQPIELSTGLFMDADPTAGVWNETEAYNIIARNYQPDHLAILPDLKGACSLDDGAGLLVNEASHENVRSMIRAALTTKFTDGDTWVEQVFNKFFIYERGDKLFKLSYTNDDSKVTLVDAPVEVVRHVEFRTTSGDFVANYQGVSEMNKKAFVIALIANSLFTPEDEAFLMGLGEERLRAFGPTLNDDGSEKAVEPKTVETPPKAEVIPPILPVGNVTPEPKTPQTVSQFIANAPPEYRGALSGMLHNHQLRKGQVIAALLANENCKFKQEELAVMNLDHLEKMVGLLGTPVVAGQTDYSGMGDLFGAPTANAGPKQEPMSLPTMNFGSKN